MANTNGLTGQEIQNIKDYKIKSNAGQLKAIIDDFMKELNERLNRGELN